MLDWYRDLAHYFPAEEMRSERHFEWLIANRPDIYRVAATPDHLLLTLDYPDVTFIDYLYVYPHCRGSGEGTRLLQSLKHKQKAILLEIEPAAPDDPESVRRRRFYDRQAFWQVDSLSFGLPSPLTWTLTDLNVLCWAPAGVVPGERVFQWMERMYQDLYAGIDPALYERPYPPVGEVLKRK
jgi:GNAT superfamily N-acetyltransferase